MIVVDLLKMVDVYRNERERLTLQTASEALALCNVEEMGPVARSGQMIGGFVTSRKTTV